MDETTYPTSIFCIIATEFCERFSFCGLRTILSLYLRNELLFAENTATVIYHVFIMVCYIIPIVGAICADSFLGRYRTILYFSLIYLFGNVLMCLAAIPPLEILSPVFLTFLGLTFIAIGTGGIKPCVAAFGGDQFHLPSQELLLQQFFSIFYFSINLGGFVGMVLTPIMRKGVTCFGDDTCYALGFGFPAALMLLALLLFVMGKPWYRLKTPKENIMLKFLNCTIYAINARIQSKGRIRKRHWLDYAEDKCGKKLIKDMKIVFAVIFLYAPLPIFWSLFDQQGSRWTFQASRMYGFVWGMQIVPDQMQVINPAIVLILIPLFDRIFYPFFTRTHLLETPLQRMAVGGLIAGLAFLCAGILELVLEKSYPELPGPDHASINIINTLPCNLTLYNPFSYITNINTSALYRFKNVIAHNYTNYSIVVESPYECGDLHISQPLMKVEVLAVEGQIDTILIGIDIDDDITAFITDPVDFRKSLNGKPRLRVAYIKNNPQLVNVSVTLQSPALQDVYYIDDCRSKLHVSAYMELPPGPYDCIVKTNATQLYSATIDLALGGVYTIVFRERGNSIDFVKLYTMSPPNKVNILWLIPQYFLISVAEIMFGIAGLEFSFTQAPKSLKTVTIAAWYLSVALGNFLVIIITQANLFKSQAYEFFLFAVLIVADMMVFMQMAVNYTFVDLEPDSSTTFVEYCDECRYCHEHMPLYRSRSNTDVDID